MRKFHIFSEHDVMVVEWPASPSLDDLYQCSELAVCSSTFSSGMPIVHVAMHEESEACSWQLLNEMAHALARYHTLGGGARGALVLKTLRQREVGLVLAEFCSQAGYELGIFKDRAEAMEWVKGMSSRICSPRIHISVQ